MVPKELVIGPSCSSSHIIHFGIPGVSVSVYSTFQLIATHLFSFSHAKEAKAIKFKTTLWAFILNKVHLKTYFLTRKG